MNSMIAVTTRRMAAIVLPLCLAVGASSEALAWDLNLGLWKSVSGSGTLRTESRDVSGFTGIALSLDGSVEIKQGGTEGVSIETDDNILPLVETIVESGTLKIRQKSGSSISTSNMKIVVNAKTLDRINISGAGEIHAETFKAAQLKAAISGSGDITIKSLETDALTVSIAGSGDFEAGGRAASMRASIAGSGEIKAGNLDTRSGDVSIAGSGDATVWTRDTLKVSIAGSGDVKYYGAAQLQKSVLGSGSVKSLGAAP